MIFQLKPTKFFLQQIDKLSEKPKRVIADKLRLIKQNPYRYKRIVGYELFLFRDRFKDEKSKRLIYLVDKPYVVVLCILDRKKEYKDLKKYLRKFGY